MTDPSIAATERAQQIFADQQAAWLAHPYPALAERKARLRALRRQIQRYQDIFVASLTAGFGRRSSTDTRMLDMLG